jgi:hypothetical protein
MAVGRAKLCVRGFVMWGDVLASVEEAWLVLSSSEELEAFLISTESLNRKIVHGLMEGRLVFTSDGPEGRFPVFRVIPEGCGPALAVVLSDEEYAAVEHGQ